MHIFEKMSQNTLKRVLTLISKNTADPAKKWVYKTKHIRGDKTLKIKRKTVPMSILMFKVGFVHRIQRVGFNGK